MARGNKTHAQFMLDLGKVVCDDGIKWLEKYKIVGTYNGAKTPIECYCIQHDEYFCEIPDRIARYKRGCDSCKAENYSKARSARFEISMGDYLIEQNLMHLWSNNNTVNPFNIGYLSHIIIKLVCPDCGCEKEIRANNFVRQKSIGCNSCYNYAGSYPSKFAFNMLKQLGIEFEIEYSPEWAIIQFRGKPRKCYYDFYIPSKNLIIEMDGGLGHGNIIHSSSDMTIEESKYIDDEKDRNANTKGIEVIRIDCATSKYEDIVNNIIVSEKLNNKIDITSVDFKLCDKFALSNLIKMVCDKRNQGYRRYEISEMFGISLSTVSNYLRMGSLHGWYVYDKNIRREEMKSIIIEKFGKRVEVFKDGVSLGIFDSYRDLSRQSDILLGEHLGFSGISRVCRGKCRYYKGFSFKNV